MLTSCFFCQIEELNDRIRIMGAELETAWGEVNELTSYVPAAPQVIYLEMR